MRVCTTVQLDSTANQLASPQPKADAFNCAQRAHTNYLENAPQTMLLTLVAGLKYPAATTLIGATWVVMRVLFLYGYVYSGQAAGAGREVRWRLLVRSDGALGHDGVWRRIAHDASSCFPILAYDYV